MVRFYTDGVFKAFWRDVLKRDPVLSETKKFSEKYRQECLDIERIANTRYTTLQHCTISCVFRV